MKKELKYNRFLNSGLSYSLVLTVILFMNLMMTDPSALYSSLQDHPNCLLLNGCTDFVHLPV